MISGIGYVEWTDGSGLSAVLYHGEQVFIKSSNYFFGKEGAEPIEVSAGVHLYKFSNRIPANAASSVEGKFGYIRYKIEVNLDIPYAKDLRSEQTFVVVRHEDLNRYQELKIPSEVEDAQTFCCFLCESDPILIRLSTYKSGFILGERFEVKVDIINRSGVNFPNSLVSLNRVESAISYSPLIKTKRHVLPMTAIHSKGVGPRKTSNFVVALNIPNNAIVSNDRVSDVFQITYEIKFQMKAPKRRSSVEVNLPIYVAHVGFREDSAQSLDSASLPMDDLRKFQSLDLKASLKFSFSSLLQTSRDS